MPELPEVETCRRGLEPHVTGRYISDMLVREARLRWPVPDDLAAQLVGCRIHRVRRRAKYLIFELSRGALLVHLGMTGSLRILPATAEVRPHDHFDVILNDGNCLRFHDPRRFGACLWTAEPVERHPLLQHLGPEPLEAGFGPGHLHDCAQRRRLAVKSLIMDARVVVGVGNIYASESLFAAGIHPVRPCHEITRDRYDVLTLEIKRVLARSIEQGGTTLRDFLREDGSPGYFSQSLNVYARDGEPCPACGALVQRLVIGQRSSFFCPNCQY